jgi:hypothetical protein
VDILVAPICEARRLKAIVPRSTPRVIHGSQPCVFDPLNATV